jgi:stress-induced morphogen
MKPSELEAAVQRALPGARVKVVDLTGTQDHYEVTVVSALFEGKSRIEQHKMVYRALQGEVGGAIHALALKTSAR